MSLLKANAVNIEQARAHVEAYGIVYFHADGNMYSEKADSDFRKDFSNPGDEAATYRIICKSASEVPATVEDLHNAFMKSKNNEIIEKSKPAANNAVKTFAVKKTETVPVPKTAKEIEDAEFEAELKKEAAAKVAKK